MALGNVRPVHHEAPAEPIHLVGNNAGWSSSVSSVDDMPSWVNILNSDKGALAQHSPLSGVLVLSLGSEEGDGRVPVCLCVTPAFKEGKRLSSLVSQLITLKYRIAVKLVIDAGLIPICLEQAVARQGSVSALSEASAIHEAWDTIISNAVAAGASDIHVRISMGRTELLFRIDGEVMLQRFNATQNTGMSMVSSMFETMLDKGSSKDPFDPRVPQTCSVTRKLKGSTIRLRYEHIPIEPSGLWLTLRVAHMSVHANYREAAALGFSPDQADDLEAVFSRASGMVIFIGTTGSGKTTSATNFLTKLVRENPGKILRSLEDPVEIIIPGKNVSQTQVPNEARLAKGSKGSVFGRLLRSLVRTDPDYLMVGEIRDSETANVAIQEVLSGHLCVATLHADAPPTAFERLIGMGVNRTDLAGVGLIGAIIHQRLVYTLCEHCKISARHFDGDDSRESAILGRMQRRFASIPDGEPDSWLDGVFFRNEKGCDHCKDPAGVKVGRSGREACASVFRPNASVSRAIRDARSDEILRLWRGMADPHKPESMRGRTSFEHGVSKVLAGRVSPIDLEDAFHRFDEDPLA